MKYAIEKWVSDEEYTPSYKEFILFTNDIEEAKQKLKEIVLTDPNTIYKLIERQEIEKVGYNIPYAEASHRVHFWIGEDPYKVITPAPFIK